MRHKMALVLWCFGVGTGVAWGSPQPVSDRGVNPSIFPLEEDLGPITEDSLFESANVALQVVNVSTGEEVYSWGGDANLTPASVMKVVTAATALKKLGGSHRFHTRLIRDADISADGILQGNLYVQGTGDPTMVVEKLWKMVYDLRVAGVTQVDGDIVFDSQYFDDRTLIEGWRKQVDMQQGPAYFAPSSALAVNYNTVCIVVSPGAEVGEPAVVRLEVPFDEISFDNQLTTVSKNERGWTRLERVMDEESGSVTYKLEGKVPEGSDVGRHYRAVHDPVQFYMSTFEQLMADQKIAVTGSFISGQVPDEAEVVVEKLSPPLAEVLNHMNKYSSNFMAEHVLKTIGAEIQGGPGTTAKGLAVVADYLEEIGIPKSEFTLVNGSGLARSISVKPSHINAVLVDMFHDERHSPEFLASMSISGVDGTLRRRFNEEDLAGRVRGKTGSLNGVACLAGYFRAADGEIYALTVLSNGVRRSRPMRSLHDRLGEALLAVDAIPLSVESESAKGPQAP